MTGEKALHEHLVQLLRWDSAHQSSDAIIANFPAKLRGIRPEGLAYTAWQLLEHLRIAQRDILEFCRKPDHVSPEFPDGTGLRATPLRMRKPGIEASMVFVRT